MDKIYRFMSFESFVDTILKKKLTFVHPSLWEDPYELHYLNKQIKNNIESSDHFNDQSIYLLDYIISKKLYCQSWTSLNESDALCRVYSHNKTSVRIAVKKSKIDLLNEVKRIEVKYIDDVEEKKLDCNSFYEFLRIKRKAFSHEKEVRLIKHYKFSNTEDAKEKLEDLLAMLGKNYNHFKKIKLEDISEEVEKLSDRLNYNIQDPTLEVSYNHIDNFIHSVMLNPFAPDWFNETLKLLCENNNINYLGKSTLYNK